MKLVLFAVVVLYLAVQGETLKVITIEHGDYGVNCTALAYSGNCDFYTKCVEAKFLCGSNGYPLDYGDKYCRRFSNSSNCFTSDVSQH